MATMQMSSALQATTDVVELRARHAFVQERLRSATNWFYWIAALSVVNSVVIAMGSDWHFLVGLGVTTVVDAIASALGTTGKIIGLVVSTMIAAFVAAFGKLAGDGRKWVLQLGMALYALDGVIFLLVGDWLSAGFHVFALISMTTGLKHFAELKELEQNPAFLATQSAPANA